MSKEEILQFLIRFKTSVVNELNEELYDIVEDADIDIDNETVHIKLIDEVGEDNWEEIDSIIRYYIPSEYKSKTRMAGYDVVINLSGNFNE